MIPESSRQTLRLNDLQVAYQQLGEGKPLLLLHGWGAHSGLVWGLAERLAPLGYACYAPDLPAFGQSDAPAQAWTVFDYTQLVLAFLDAIGLDKVYLFGHSFGGRLGLILGADHPQRLHKMALANSAGLRPRLPLTTHLRTQAYKSVRNGLNALGLHNLASSLRNAYNARYGSSDFNATDGTLRQTFVNIISQDLASYAARVRVPTLLFWGDQDQDTPLWMGKTLEKLIPDSGLVVYKGAGHYSYIEHLAQTAHVVDYFFKQA